MSACCGLDFGTSNTALALVREGRSVPLVLDPRHRPPETIPTLLYFSPDHLRAYGTEAVDAYLERAMAGRFIQSIKRYLPSKTFDYTMINGRTYDLSELIAGFLEHLKWLAERATGAPVERVLLGRPARFDPDPDRDRLAERRLEQAAALAGFDEIRFRIEPIAAARAFEQQLDREVLCLVGDLGGGTSDFTVMRLGPERVGRLDRSGDILGSDGVSVGGNDFDAALVRRFVLPHLGGGSQYRPLGRWIPVPSRLHAAMTSWHQLSFVATPENLRALRTWIRTADDAVGLERLLELLEWNYGFQVFQAVERAKVALSTAAHTRLRFAEGGVTIDEPVSRADFEVAVRPLTERLEQTIDALMETLGLQARDVTAVFLTGGTSLIPCVRDLFRARFGDRLLERDAFTSVGAGLGVEAAEIWG
ncbi:MAG: Hsp70 family protein [Alphaproteobacteria bacterium]|nr:Hsp70 family protein [Alphaproteobacteria bacterium]